MTTSGLRPCPACSCLRRGLWLLVRPSLRYGQHARRWTLDSCTWGCPVFGEECPWIAEFDGVPPMFNTDEEKPLQRIRTSEACQALLGEWWTARVAAYDFSGWSAEKRQSWEAQV